MPPLVVCDGCVVDGGVVVLGVVPVGTVYVRTGGVVCVGWGPVVVLGPVVWVTVRFRRGSEGTPRNIPSVGMVSCAEVVALTVSIVTERSPVTGRFEFAMTYPVANPSAVTTRPASMTTNQRRVTTQLSLSVEAAKSADPPAP